MAWSSAASALGLPSCPIRRRVNTGLRQHREGFQLAQAEREHLAGHREASRENLVPSARLESLRHHHIFGASPPQRYPPPLAHRQLQRIEGIRGQGSVLWDLRHAVYATAIAPGTPFTMRPIGAATSVFSRRRASTRAFARVSGTAISSPPEVWASNSNVRG